MIFCNQGDQSFETDFKAVSHDFSIFLSQLLLKFKELSDANQTFL